MSDHPTQVMSLDELMDLAAEPRDDTATAQIRTTPAPVTPSAPAPLDLTRSPQPEAPQPAQPQASPPPAGAQRGVAAGPDLRERVVADARRAFDAAVARGRVWLKQGDNALITATVVAALLLLLVVAAA